jgi:hypothetical protein
VYRKSRSVPEKESEAERAPKTLKLTDQYIALLLLVFTNAGLLDASSPSPPFYRFHVLK